MKKIIVIMFALALLIASPSITHAYGNYTDCVAAKNLVLSNGTKNFSIAINTNEHYSSFVYKVIQECNALPGAPSVTPTNMTITDVMLTVISRFPVSQMPYSSASILSKNPYLIIAAGGTIAENQPTQPTNPPSNTDQGNNTNPIVSGVVPPPVSNGYSTCPPDNSVYLTNQIAPLRASNETLQASNTALTTQVASLQIQLSGSQAQIANLTKALTDANAKLKEANKATIVVPVAPVIPQVVAPVIQPEVIQEVKTPTQQENTNIMHRFTQWLGKIF